MSSKNPKRMHLFLVVLAAASAASFQGWRTLLNNFAVETAHLTGADIGLVQSVREVPGFLALLVVFVLFLIREHRLAALSVAVLGAGVSLAGFFPSLGGVMVTTLVMSFGFHYYETLNQSLTLQYFGKAQAPIVISRLRSVNAASNIAMGGVVFLAAGLLGFKGLFLLAGGISLIAGAWLFFIDPTDKELPLQRKGMVLRKRYWLFYFLTFLAGARRQIFVAFAVFLLVQEFDYSVRDVTVLFVINNVINMAANPIIGRAINRFGERTVLTIEYAGLVAVFTAYAMTGSPLVAGAIYVVDNLLFNFATAVRTFFQKIADPGDIAPSMAVGFTINHIAAVAIPVLGGLAWMVDYRTVFLGAAALAVLSLILVQLIPGQLARAEQNP